MRVDDLDDVAPPNADSDMLRRVRDRGRRLQQHRRATRGAVLALIAVGLVGGVVAIGGHDTPRSTVSVDATTTTRLGASTVTERDADAHGLHYVIRLTTPIVAPHAEIHLELRVDNRTGHVVGLDSCALNDIRVLRVDNPRLPSTRRRPACAGVGIGLSAHGSYTYRGRTAAPGDPGRYLVRANPDPRDGFPLSLLAPLDLQVTATTSSTKVTAPTAVPTTTPETTTPQTPRFAYLYVYPFSSPADAQAWQRAYESAGHQPWHLDAGLTATSFADFLGYAMADQVISIHTDASGAHVALGYHNPNGIPVTAAGVHLVRVGNAKDAPWEVVGNDQSSGFTLTTPSNGTAISSPVRVAGTITGVDENIRISVREQSSSGPVGEFCCLPAGGVNSPWSATVSLTNATDPVLVISASTGGHLQTIERFVFTATRRAG